MEILKEDVPDWMKKGGLYRTMAENDDDHIIFPIYVADDNVENSSKFSTLIEFSKFTLLDEYPLSIYIYGYYNKDEVIKYLEDKLKNEHYDYFNDDHDEILATDYLLFFIKNTSAYLIKYLYTISQNK